jgi:diguanylate cyclase (GGDEF)-like protein/PAS domain S-box-containing protein
MGNAGQVIFDSVNTGILVIAVDNDAFIDANPRLCEMFDYTRLEMLALDIEHLSADVAPATVAYRAALRARATSGEAFMFEWACRAKNGRLFWCDVAVRGAVFDGRDVFLLSAQDITTRRTAQDGLAYRDRVLHAITASAAMLVTAPSLPDSMPHALKAVGEALDIDRLSVIEGSAPAVSLSVPTFFTWQKSADLLPLSFAAVLGRRNSVEIATWLAPLLERKPVSALADTSLGLVAQIMRDTHTLSILLLPIEASENYWGFLEVNDCRTARHWTSIEIEALGVFAQIAGGVISRQTMQSELQRSEDSFRAVADTVFDAIVMVDMDGRITYWNHAAERMWGYTADEANGKLLSEFLVPQRLHEQGAQRMAGFLASAGIGQTVEVITPRKDGTELTIELSINAMTLGPARYLVGVARDITERQRTTALIERMAGYDTLTGLPNRRLFIEALEQAIGRANRSGQIFGVLYLDLDHFKDVNDTLGHPMGDRLLQLVAERLQANVRDTDTVARFGGDEFAAIVIDVREPEDAAILADKLVKALRQPFSIDGIEVHSGTSVGIAVYGPDSPDAEALLSHADVALYRAKTDGRGTYRFYTDAMDAEVRARVAIETDLSTAVAAGQFFLLYQPQVEVDSGRIVGLEALVRWQHPTRGVLQPESFITAAERSGTMVALGRFILQEACRQAKRWLDAGIAPPLVAVNVSGVQFKAPLELENDIGTILAESGLAPKMLELELTESVLKLASQAQNDELLRLRGMGLRFSIDNFGTGYSSLDYLCRFHVDRIKIPETFITDIGTVSNNASIVHAILGLASALDIEVVVEGVETAAQLALLKAWGCRNIQGFYFAKPLSVPDVTALLRIGSVTPAHLSPLGLDP